MKNVRLLVLFLLVGGLLSCSQEVIVLNPPHVDKENKRMAVSYDEFVSLVFADAQKMSSDEASHMLDGFLKTLPFSGRSDRPVSFRLKGTEYLSLNTSAAHTRSNSEDAIPLYHFEVAGEESSGFAVVSGDGRCPGVVAYVPYGDADSLDNRDDAKMMMGLSELFVVAKVNKIQHLVDSLRDDVVRKVSLEYPEEEITEENAINYVRSEKTIEGETFSRDYPRSPVYEEPATAVVYKDGPYTVTAWSQDNPYNGALPSVYRPNFGVNFPGNYPLGCGVVAAMQVLAYLKPSMTINGLKMDWDKMTEKAEISGGGYSDELMMVTALGKHVFEGTKSVANIKTDGQYGPYDDKTIPIVESTSTKVSEIYSFLNKYVTCGDFYERFASDALLTAIRGKHVSIMGGTCPNKNTNHAWIIDGFAICKKSTREILRQNDLYFHANMGLEGGEYSGYYRVDPKIDISFELKDYETTYSKDFWVISDIRPK